MINLKEYFHKNRSDYYLYKFTFSSSNIDFFIYDENDAIKEFKKLIDPYNQQSNPKYEHIDMENDEKFIYICNYLNENRYIIEQFPEFLKKPSSRWDLSYNIIREELKKLNKYEDNIVPWSDRREYVKNIVFKKIDNYKIDKDLEDIIIDISTTKNKFNLMSNDEKLQNLCNSIEYLLKKDKKFIIPDYGVTYGLLSDEIVKKYKNIIQIFRHATKEDIEKRKEMPDFNKTFLIEFGLIILNFLKGSIK